MSQANCKFCGCTDDSIQVICESRCLICSRCQQIPAIRKLLVDHTIAIDVNPSTASQVTQTYLKGFCPVCENPMTSTMLSLISTFKELYRNAPDDVKNKGRLMTGMELEEYSTAISGFLKRYRATYEADVRKTRDSLGPGATVDNRFMACMADIYDLYTVPTKTSQPAVMEFIAESYIAQWNSMLRNGRESMVSTIMRLFNRKRFSQRTNDLRTKAVLDYMAGATGSETVELLLFGRLIGLQPRQTANISPAWTHITSCVFAAGLTDIPLKTGQFIDITGQPSLTEVKTKIVRMCTSHSKTISLKRALKILEIFNSDKQPYWVMAPIIPSCVEYASKFPWDETSLHKLLTIIFFVAFFEAPNNTNIATGVTAAVAQQSGGLAGAPAGGRSTILSTGTMRSGGASSPAALPLGLRMPSGNPSAMPSAPQSGAQTPIGGGARGAGEVGGTGGGAGVFSAPNSAPTSPNRSRRPSVAMSSGPTAAAGGVVDLVDEQIFSSGRVVTLRSLDSLVKDIWASKFNPSVSSGSIDSQIYFLANLNRHNYPSHLHISWERAYELAEGRSISLSEFAYACIHCWDAEYSTVKNSLSSGTTTFKRRGAISGHYDTTKAHMNAAERLCLTRLLHWYSDEHNFHGVDWNDVIINAKERLFPFNVPASLLKKSQNELHHLEQQLAEELREQKRKDALEDEMDDQAYSPDKTRGGSGSRRGTAAAALPVTLSELEKFNRQQYLASQSIGYVDKIRLEDAVVDEVHHAELKQHHPHRSNTMDPRVIEQFRRESALGHGQGYGLGQGLARSAGVVESDASLVAGMDELNHALKDMHPHQAYAPNSANVAVVNNRTGAYGYPGGSEGIKRTLTAGGLQRPLSPSGLLSSVPGGDPYKTHAGVEVSPVQEYHFDPNHPGGGIGETRTMNTHALAIATATATANAAGAGAGVDGSSPQKGGMGSSAGAVVGEDMGVGRGGMGGKKRSLSSLSFTPARASSMPIQHQTNMVDILDNDPAVLTSAGMLRPHPGAPKSAVGTSITIPEAVALGGGGDESIMGTTQGAVVNGDLIPLHTGGFSKELTELEKQVQQMQINDPFAMQPGMTHVPSSDVLRGRPGSSATYEGNMNVPPYNSAEFYYKNNPNQEDSFGSVLSHSNEVDHKYSSVLDALRKSKLEAAKRKVQDRIDRKAARAEQQAKEEAAQAAASTAARLGGCGGQAKKNASDESKASGTDGSSTGAGQGGGARGGFGTGVGSETGETKDLSSTIPTGAVGSAIASDAPIQKKNPRNLNSKLRQLPYLDFNKYITQWGRVMIDCATHLSSESGVKFFSMRDRSINAATFEYIAANYFKPWQMANLLRIDLARLNLGPPAATVLQNHFSKCCQLIHLNLNGMRIGGAGLKKVLEGIIQGGGVEHILRLELQGNDITIALESFSLIGKFSNLRALDLSHNCFTLDTTTQCRTFTNALAPLHKLQSLSLAFNKIQDAGLRLVCDIAKTCLPALRLLDLAGCFLTKECFAVLNNFLRVGGSEEARTTNIDLEEIMLQRNVFTPGEEQDISEKYSNISRVKIDTWSRYIGISFPLRYELRDYGLEHFK